MAKEVSVRLHEELERLETKRSKSNEELERTKKLLDESESRRITLQKEVNSVTSEVRLHVYCTVCQNGTVFNLKARILLCVSRSIIASSFCLVLVDLKMHFAFALIYNTFRMELL
jgi:hypothetical protein